MTGKACERWILGSLLLVVLAVFSRGFQNGATSVDDDALVFDNTAQQHFGWAEVQQALDPRAPRDDYGLQYAPLSDFSYALDRQVFGVVPAWYHVQGLLFHLVATWALFALARRQGATDVEAGIAAAIFALHPLQVEPVAWISGRRTAMAGCFLLLAALAWSRAREPRSGAGGWRQGAVSVLFAVLGNLAKQSAVVSGPLVAVVEWTAPRSARDRFENEYEKTGRWRQWGCLILAYLPHIAVTVGFVALGLWIGQREEVVRAAPIGAARRAMVVLFAIGSYAHLLAWPAHLRPVYRAELSAGWLDSHVIAGACVVAGGLALIVWSMRRRRAPLAGFGTLLAAIALAPGAHGLGTQVVADRYCYLTVGGAAIALVGLLRVFRGGTAPATPPGPGRARAVGLALLAAAAVALAVATYARIAVWQDDVTLFADAVESDPENPITQRWLGRSLVEAGHLDEGERHLRRAAAIYWSQSFDGPWRFPAVIEDLAKLLELRGDLSLAEQYLRQACDVSRPHEADRAASALGQFYLRRGDPVRARAAFKDGIDRDGERATYCLRRLAALDTGAASLATSRSDPAAPFAER